MALSKSIFQSAAAFATYLAQIAEVEVAKDGAVRRWPSNTTSENNSVLGYVGRTVKDERLRIRRYLSFDFNCSANLARSITIR